MTRTKKTSATPPPLVVTPQQVFEAAFALLAEKGLGKLRLSAIARRLSIPVKGLYKEYPTVEALLFRFLDHVDQAMIETVTPVDAEGEKRDLYFDMLMARFDCFQEHREGVVRWFADLSRFPQLWVTHMCRWDQSLSLMLDIAQDSPLFPMKKIGLAGIDAATMRSWLKDDTEDMAKTMVTLDQMLEKGGRFIDRFMTRKK